MHTETNGTQPASSSPGPIPSMGKNRRISQRRKKTQGKQSNAGTSPETLEKGQGSQESLRLSVTEATSLEYLPTIKHNKHFPTPFDYSRLVCSQYSHDPARADTLSQFRVQALVLLGSIQELVEYCYFHQITLSEFETNLRILNFSKTLINELKRHQL